MGDFYDYYVLRGYEPNYEFIVNRALSLELDSLLLNTLEDSLADKQVNKEVIFTHNMALFSAVTFCESQPTISETFILNDISKWLAMFNTMKVNYGYDIFLYAFHASALNSVLDVRFKDVNIRNALYNAIVRYIPSGMYLKPDSNYYNEFPLSPITLVSGMHCHNTYNIYGLFIKEEDSSNKSKEAVVTSYNTKDWYLGILKVREFLLKNTSISLEEANTFVYQASTEFLNFLLNNSIMEKQPVAKNRHIWDIYKKTYLDFIIKDIHTYKLT